MSAFTVTASDYIHTQQLATW